MKLRAFAKDLNACAFSPWLKARRLPAFGLLMIERWNAYSPVKWQPELKIPISYGGRSWTLPMRMSSEDYAAFREIFLYRYYDHDLGDPRTILDLGGYCGYTALAFSARFPKARIAAVEPHPENFVRLSENVKMNGLPVSLFEGAATVADGPVSLYVGGGMTHGLKPSSYSTGETIAVRGLSVPTILDQLGWRSVDLLKIDIEGAEEPLFGARQPWLRQVKTIIGEYHGSYRFPNLKADLEPLGFLATELPHPNIFLAVRTH
jgi:FkbM family methyltransferase